MRVGDARAVVVGIDGRATFGTDIAPNTIDDAGTCHPDIAVSNTFTGMLASNRIHEGIPITALNE